MLPIEARCVYFTRKKANGQILIHSLGGYCQKETETSLSKRPLTRLVGNPNYSKVDHIQASGH